MLAFPGIFFINVNLCSYLFTRFICLNVSVMLCSLCEFSCSATSHLVRIQNTGISVCSVVFSFQPFKQPNESFFFLSLLSVSLIIPVSPMPSLSLATYPLLRLSLLLSSRVVSSLSQGPPGSQASPHAPPPPNSMMGPHGQVAAPVYSRTLSFDRFCPLCCFSLAVLLLTCSAELWISHVLAGILFVATSLDSDNMSVLQFSDKLICFAAFHVTSVWWGSKTPHQNGQPGEFINLVSVIVT